MTAHTGGSRGSRQYLIATTIHSGDGGTGQGFSWAVQAGAQAIQAGLPGGGGAARRLGDACPLRQRRRRFAGRALRGVTGQLKRRWAVLIRPGHLRSKPCRPAAPASGIG